MASLFKLVGSIFVDNEEANKSISKTETKAESLGNSLLNGAKKAGKFAAGLTTAAAGAAAGLTKLAKNTSASADTVDKASQRMGVSAESYQELAHAASLSGVEMSTLEKAAKSLDEGMTFDQAMDEIYSLQTAEERAARAAELFGEGVAYNLTPMLTASGEEMAAMKQEARDLGLVMSEDTVAAGAALDDAMSNVSDALGALVNNIGASLMPIVKEVCDFIIANLPMIQGLVDQLGPVLVDMFQKIMPPLMSLAQTILPILANLFEILLPIFADIVGTILPVLVQLIQTLLPPILQIVQAILPVLVNLLDALLPILQPLLSLLTPILNLVMTLLQPLLDLINLILPPITALIQALVGVIADYLLPAVNKFATVIVSALATAFGTVKTILDNLKQKFLDVFTKIKDGIKTPVNAVIGFINGLISGITGGINSIVRAMNKLQFDVPDWVPGIGGKSFGFNLSELTAPQIPLLAQGAVIEPNKPFAAVLGDQTQGTNIEAPLDTIKQAVAEVLAEMRLDINVNASPNTSKWFEDMQAEARIYTRRTGLPAMP